MPSRWENEWDKGATACRFASRAAAISHVVAYGRKVHLVLGTPDGKREFDGAPCRFGNLFLSSRPPADLYWDIGDRQWVKVNPTTIVAIQDDSEPNYPLWLHRNYRYGLVALEQVAASCWAVLIDGVPKATLPTADQALKWIQDHGLAIHALEDLYAE